MAESGLVAAIQHIIDNVETAAEIAGNMCRIKAEQDFNKAAKQAVDYYYEYPVTSYYRQYHLYDIYNVTSTLKKRKGVYTIKTEIKFDSGPLDGVYHSHSSKHNGGGAWSSGGDVEGDWVFKNFLRGAHPWTQEIVYKEEYKSGLNVQEPSPNKYLREFINSYGPNHFEPYFQKSIALLLSSLL